ncbi:MAG: hypothetical protein AB1640_07265 [bacterium]
MPWRRTRRHVRRLEQHVSLARVLPGLEPWEEERIRKLEKMAEEWVQLVGVEAAAQIIVRNLELFV